MEEIWKETHISPFYQVSNLGNVRSVDRFVKGRIEGFPAFRIGKLLKPAISKTGYPRVLLMFDGIRKNISVHRLVAIAFIENELNKETVNHIDGNKLNNCVSNLEWASVKENNNHARRLGLNVAKSGKECHTYGFKYKHAIKLMNTKTGVILPIVEAHKFYPLITRRHFTMMVNNQRTNKTIFIKVID